MAVAVGTGAGISNTASGFSKICRTCAACTDCLMPIFSGEGLLNNLADKIQRHLPIQVSEWDRLPQQLCQQCANTLLAWHELVKCCTQADAALRVRLQRLQQLSQQENVATTSTGSSATEKLPSEQTDQNYKCSGDVTPPLTHHLQQSETGDIFTLSNNSLDYTNINIKDESLSSLNCYDVPIQYSSQSDSDEDKPLVELASEKISKEQVNQFYAALVRLRKHFESQHCATNGVDSESDSDATIPLISNDRQEQSLLEKEDLTLCNNRRDNFDPEIREELSRAKHSLEGRVYYRCERCGRDLRTAHTYIQHRRIHTGEKPCVCHLCGKQFRVSAGLQRHVRETHQHLRLHACSVCHKRFANRQTLAQHRRIHTGEKPFVCSQCGRRFTQSGSLQVHMRTHTDSFPHACASCPARFRQRSALTHHVYSHTGEKPHACAECGRAYRTRHQLNTHTLTHTQRRPHACPVCRLTFLQRRTVRNHCRRHHPLVNLDSQTPI